MIVSRTPKLAIAAILCVVGTAPAALAATSHQMPTHARHVVAHTSLTSGAWTPMVDESRLDAPFNESAAANGVARFLSLRP